MQAPARRTLTRAAQAAQSASSIGSTTPVTVTSASLRRAAARPSPINTAAAQAQAQQPRTFSTTATTPVRPTVTTVTTWTARVKEAVDRSRARAYSSDVKENKIWGFEEMQKLIEDPKREVVIVDAREPGELSHTGRIPGAINIPITTSPDSFFISEDEFEDRFGFPRPSKDSEVVFYCKAGVRSRGAAGLAREAGWEKVGEYPGSWLDWAAKGGKVEH
ncbi:Rhodanese-like domain-containing protein [Sordaria brevicollis]|uniref:Rhodanese-like domain-containing protein n=1 Tax=Sordaria brevicollis TaxID=83679 RepID=A0AAE0PF46_SORBR|nr:Rhodanese-like domain-containing protein [Sordaria brevicollis]